MADEYNNPVDGKTYVTDGWKTHYPEKPRIKDDSRIENIGIRLLGRSNRPLPLTNQSINPSQFSGDPAQSRSFP
ncbi:MAG: hypothetical protein GY749_17830 [Desulfobacteraceae bacterium]|nr:hypothetical protein [Desulfobacteraceae bacterium]